MVTELWRIEVGDVDRLRWEAMSMRHPVFPWMFCTEVEQLSDGTIRLTYEAIPYQMGGW